MARGFQEIVKALRDASIDPKVRSILIDMWQMIEENTQQIHQTAEATLALAKSLEQVVGLHEMTQGLVGGVRARLDDLQSMGKTPGVEVGSVPLVDDKGE